jgi:NodT family efflux transporter outer membrane factor (OMF) lipoprotein
MRKTNSSRRAVLALAGAALLAGCVSYKGIDPRATARSPSDLSDARTLDGVAVSNAAWPAGDWWTRLGDPQLNQLVSEALSGSPGIRAAIAREDAALANATVIGARQGLGVNIEYDWAREIYSKFGLVPLGFGGRWFTANQLLLNFQYQVDFWGQNRAALQAALGQAKADEAEIQAARLSLAAAVTLAYIELARNFEQRDLQQAAVAQREALIDLARQRVSAGLDSEIDLRQVEVSLPEARARIVQYDQAIAAARNQIAALLGQGPDRGQSITRPQLSGDAAAVALPSVLPADLLGRRPDIVAARWRVEAAQRDIQSAKAAFYPNINLTAWAGVQSLLPSKFLTLDSQTMSFGPAIRLPLFQSGTLKGTLAARDADYDTAVEHYSQLLADALREVVDGVGALRFAELQDAELQRTLSLSQDSVRLAREREAGGMSTHLPVLTAEGQVLLRRAALADLKAARLAYGVGLMRALGGGYQEQGSGATTTVAGEVTGSATGGATSGAAH